MMMRGSKPTANMFLSGSRRVAVTLGTKWNRLSVCKQIAKGGRILDSGEPSRLPIHLREVGGPVSLEQDDAAYY